MNQRTYMGTTLLDVTKASIETFMKLRGRDPNSRLDRYMLLTFEDPPANIKAGWKESHASFVTELKHLRAIGLTSLGAALKHSFDLLNVNRMQSGIDTYGQGRCPFYLEPAMVIVVTDGGKLTTPNTVQYELNLPMTSTVPGSELTKEPFRWDQRIFSIVMRLPGTIPHEMAGPTYVPSADNTYIDAMCDVTGGRSYAVSSQRMLNATLESLVQKVQSGVVISFEKFGPDPMPINGEGKTETVGFNGSMKENRDINRQDILDQDGLTVSNEKTRASTPVPMNAGWHSCRRLIYVPRSAQKGYPMGHWPIPEGFWPDLNSSTLPSRTCHPVVKFSCTACEPMTMDNMPFDKYELEPSPLTQYILNRRQPSICWQVFVSNSAKYSDMGNPFGYLKASGTLSTVNLFVMPYNYPVLFPLLDELFKVHKMKPTQKWRQQFENYLTPMPIYYAGPLKRALARMGAPNLVPDNMENCLSYSVISYLKKLKNQAKIEMDRLVASVGTKVPLSEGIKIEPRTKTSFLQRKDFQQILEHTGGNISSLKQELVDCSTFSLAVSDKEIMPQCYRNPYDISRSSLLDQVARMRANFLHTSTANTKLLDDDQFHSIPVQQMGNYQEYLKRQPSSLRELETQPERLHMFGNPFKVNKNITIDEADEAMVGVVPIRIKRQHDTLPSSSGPRKRKPGPLPRDIVARRPSTPLPDSVTPPLSPVPFYQPTPNHILQAQDAKPPDPRLPPPVPPSTCSDSEDQENEPMATNHFDEEWPLPRVTNHVINTVNNEPITEQDIPKVLVNNSDEDVTINSLKDSAVLAHNLRLRMLVYKEIKKPGKNHESLFKQLATIQGHQDSKRAFVKDIVREAARFKRRSLIEQLTKFEQSLAKSELKKLNKFGSPS